MSSLIFGSNDNVIFSNNTSKDLTVGSDNVTYKMDSNDGTHKFAIKDSDNTELWSVDTSGTVTGGGGSGNGDYMAINYDAGSFHVVNCSGWTNVFTLVSESVIAQGIAMNSSTGIITLTGKCIVNMTVIGGANNGSNGYLRARMRLDGSTISSGSARVFQSAGYSSVTLHRIIPSGTSLDLQLNGVGGGGNQTILTSVSVSIHNI